MTKKAGIYFSNSFSQLSEHLKGQLFQMGSLPFERRLIVVPHLGLKTYLMEEFAQDPRLQIAAAMEVVSLSKALTEITKKKWPTLLELSLFIQQILPPLIQKDGELNSYFQAGDMERRIGPFSDHLARCFDDYSIYGKPFLPTWQEAIWREVVERWQGRVDLHSAPKIEGQIHLFGFNFIPIRLFELFEKVGGQFYLFSPCRTFWSDFISEKEKSVFRRGRRAEAFEATFEGQNPLLSSLGKLGRKMALSIEERGDMVEEAYADLQGFSCLSRLQQDCIDGVISSFVADETVICFSATTRRREVEILKDQLLSLISLSSMTLRDIQVLAPDISLYAPYIEVAFKEIGYALYDLDGRKIDREVGGLIKLIALHRERFSVQSLLQLIADPLFQKKFPVDEELTKKWLKITGARWGFSQEQRRKFYLEEMEEDKIQWGEEGGCLRSGLNRLLFGFAKMDGEGDPLPAIDVADMEQFNRLYTLIESLADDLSPWIDGTRWPISTWLLYFATLFETYFPIDREHPLYVELLQLADALKDVQGSDLSYVAVERVLAHLISKKSYTKAPSDRQFISFRSLRQGAILPGKVIALLGLEEGQIETMEERGPFRVSPPDFCPTSADEERYLFLQTLLSARETLVLSYVRGRKGEVASPLIDSLLSQIEGGKCTPHPDHPFDGAYFQGGELKTYDRLQYQVAMGRRDPIKRPLLIPDWQKSSSPFVLTDRASRPINKANVAQLVEFARHPLRYYFRHVLGMRSKGIERGDEREYRLAPPIRTQLVREALFAPIDQVFAKANRLGQLPGHLLQRGAKREIHDEVAQWKRVFALLDILPEELGDREVILQVGDVSIEGKLEGVTPKGVLVRGENSPEDRIRFWPQGLLSAQLGLPLVFIKDGHILRAKGSLEEYLHYFSLAQESPSPLLPTFAGPLLVGNAKELAKRFESMEDGTWQTLLMRDPPPIATFVHEKWSGYLQSLFGEVYAPI